MNTRNLLTVGAALLFSFTVIAGDRRRVRAVSPPSPPLAIAFVEGDLLETGTIAWHGGAKRATVTTRTVRMRIGEPAGESRGNATVRAYLETVDPRCTIRVDGVPLTTVPRVIRHHAPVGVAFALRIEVEVPVTAPDGPLQASIGWEAATE
jgi:hypothetical protein